jgi:hypothetical protein
MAASMVRPLFVVLLIFKCVSVSEAKKDDKVGENEKWKKKDVRDYTDADIERLYDQWEVSYFRTLTHH